jgi:hypothetical protein
MLGYYQAEDSFRTYGGAKIIGITEYGYHALAHPLRCRWHMMVSAFRTIRIDHAIPSHSSPRRPHNYRAWLDSLPELLTHDPTAEATRAIATSISVDLEVIGIHPATAALPARVGL